MCYLFITYFLGFECGLVEQWLWHWSCGQQNVDSTTEKS